MNSLVERFPSHLAVLAFPSNQFGHQENCEDGEILATLRWVDRVWYGIVW